MSPHDFQYRFEKIPPVGWFAKTEMFVLRKQPICLVQQNRRYYWTKDLECPVQPSLFYEWLRSIIPFKLGGAVKAAEEHHYFVSE